ncbi:unnamed protein product [Protopolystoma xenopodis]|uniref:Uncharacterized protein n=1 Tax=Protopolystoma xenopodis TaxID=117903 RepID=A0A3S4ZYX8_9PLAT|nr:unnamed protein product [Protopolystoma xenopodis]
MMAGKDHAGAGHGMIVEFPGTDEAKSALIRLTLLICWADCRLRSNCLSSVSPLSTRRFTVDKRADRQIGILSKVCLCPVVHLAQPVFKFEGL